MHLPSQALLRSCTAHATVLIAAATLCVPSLMQAQAEIGPVLGTEYGFGALARAGSSRLQLEVGAGIAPVISYVTVIGGSDIFRVYLPVTVGAKVSFRLRVAELSGQIHAEVGGSYNHLLGLGVGGGISYRRAPSRLLVSAGVMLYPEAKDRMRNRVNDDEGMAISDDAFQSPLTFYQPYVSIAIMFGR